MDTLLTTAQVAAQIGCTPRTVRRRAGAENLGRILGGVLLFSPAEAKKLAGMINPGQPGNPRIAEQSAAGVAARKKNRK